MLAVNEAVYSMCAPTLKLRRTPIAVLPPCVRGGARVSRPIQLGFLGPTPRSHEGPRPDLQTPLTSRHNTPIVEAHI
jgi:hypothetical protein